MKLYADEPEHEEVRQLSALAIGAAARVEVPAALWRKQRLGELEPGDARILVLAFEADCADTGGQAARFAMVALTADVLEAAAQLVAIHPLRSYDGIQLACALAAREADPGCARFACFDGQLRAAAAARGFELVPA